jgi:hypothetical protein
MFKVSRLPAAAIAITLASVSILSSRVVADQSADVPVYSEALANLNVALARSGVANLRIERAEISVARNGVDSVTTIVANNRTHQLGSQFVARDPRRGGLADLSYLVDQSDGIALSIVNNGIVALPNSVTEPAIDRAMHRWGNSTQCPSPALSKIADDGSDPDLVDGLVFGDPARIGTPRADITQAGWLPAAFFNALTANGAQFILGVTFTFDFTDDVTGEFTDIDRDGNLDVAFREIYYNRSFPWTTDAALSANNVDIESVVTHESGHALGLGHFGKVFVDNQGTLKFAPRAVMNAVYVSPFRDLAGTDDASYCSVWASRK